MVSDPDGGRVRARTPELTARQFEDMLAEIDALCRQARELTTALGRRMEERKQLERQVLGPRRFPRTL